MTSFSNENKKVRRDLELENLPNKEFSNLTISEGGFSNCTNNTDNISSNLSLRPDNMKTLTKKRKKNIIEAFPTKSNENCVNSSNSVNGYFNQLSSDFLSNLCSKLSISSNSPNKNTKNYYDEKQSKENIRPLTIVSDLNLREENQINANNFNFMSKHIQDKEDNIVKGKVNSDSQSSNYLNHSKPNLNASEAYLYLNDDGNNDIVIEDIYKISCNKVKKSNLIKNSNTTMETETTDFNSLNSTTLFDFSDYNSEGTCITVKDEYICSLPFHFHKINDLLLEKLISKSSKGNQALFDFFYFKCLEEYTFYRIYKVIIIQSLTTNSFFKDLFEKSFKQNNNNEISINSRLFLNSHLSNSFNSILFSDQSKFSCTSNLNSYTNCSTKSVSSNYTAKMLESTSSVNNNFKIYRNKDTTDSKLIFETNGFLNCLDLASNNSQNNNNEFRIELQKINPGRDSNNLGLSLPEKSKFCLEMNFDKFLQRKYQMKRQNIYSEEFELENDIDTKLIMYPVKNFTEYMSCDNKSNNKSSTSCYNKIKCEYNYQNQASKINFYSHYTMTDLQLCENNNNDMHRDDYA